MNELKQIFASVGENVVLTPPFYCDHGSKISFCGDVVINPGVTIGNDVVIGSGSVVTKDIPSHVIAAGNPCRVIREITEQDRETWQKQYEEYLTDTQGRHD